MCGGGGIVHMVQPVGGDCSHGESGGGGEIVHMIRLDNRIIACL